jgi:hypothetical protein
MQPSDIATLLKNFGFTDLSLVKVDGKLFTFKFGSYNHKKLTTMFGAPSIAGSGKVAVFEVPDYGKLGVSPSNLMVRLSYTGSHVKTEYNDTHLSKHDTTSELSLLFDKAKISPNLRTKYLTSLWEFYNKEKFQGRLPKSKIITSIKPPTDGVSKNVRGFFQPDQKIQFGPGTVWIADKLFNSNEAFVNEIFLHELCHMAVSCIDKTREILEAGHGPLWQKWMRHVGLDPRRFDPTEEVVYQDKVTQAITEEKLNRAYGKRTPPSEFKKLEKVTAPTTAEVAVDIHGRMMIGKFLKSRSGYHFTCVAPNKSRLTFVFKTFPKDRTYMI